MSQKRKTGATLKQVKAPRQPVAWAKVIKSMLMLVAVTVVLTGASYLQTDEILPIKHVTVEGALQHTDRAALVSSVTPFVSGSFINVDVARIREVGEKLPWVKQIQVRRVWPDTLHLIVEEQTAIARWNDKGLVDTTGSVFFPDEQSLPQGLIRLFGPKGASEMMVRRLAEIQPALGELGLHINEVKMDGRRSWQLNFSEGLQLKLGRADSQTRLERFIRVYKGGLDKYQSQIATIDMRYTNGLAVVWKQGQKPVFNGTV